jgi:hypothetical protein
MHLAEWEWGWKTPLLLRFPDEPPAEVSAFLATPLERIALAEAEASFTRRTAELRTSRIGIRFERVQAALFDAHPDTRSLRTNLVIPGKTEIDLLHRLRTLPDTIIHWEVAVKFYLGLDVGGSLEADRFIGPSLKDTLGIKTRAIFGRQLAVLTDPTVRASLGAAFGILPGDAVLRLPKVHGILFLPFHGRVERRRPPTVTAEGLRGAWTPIDRLPEFIASVEAETGDAKARVRWLRDRTDWIRDPARVLGETVDETPLKGFLNSGLALRFQSHFADHGEPIQATVLMGGKAPTEFRFFVVPSGWPDKAERELETLRGGSRIKA